ncbi:BnaC07g15840D [Brassica napus]|uniref:BnaC07g15840D protein n=1 Tax=Brassica napus TaxID=3708 RepID=A0A078FIN2_BRANA|nr:BnaC07g15840D [Brassica napus]
MYLNLSDTKAHRLTGQSLGLEGSTLFPSSRFCPKVFSLVRFLMREFFKGDGAEIGSTIGTDIAVHTIDRTSPGPTRTSAILGRRFVQQSDNLIQEKCDHLWIRRREGVVQVFPKDSLSKGVKKEHLGLFNNWRELWFSTTEPLSPVGPPTLKTSEWCVDKLILPGSDDWDATEIREVLPQYEEIIRKLTPSAMGAPDKRVWLQNALGIYSTKSGYAIAKLYNGILEDRIFNWKKCVWQVDTSPKIKHFLWKANNEALPVGSVTNKGMTVNPVCKRCGAHETELPVLLQCPFATKAWELVPCIFKPDVICDNPPFRIKWSRSISREDWPRINWWSNRRQKRSIGKFQRTRWSKN